jgi:hypothetical protein
MNQSTIPQSKIKWLSIPENEEKVRVSDREYQARKRFLKLVDKTQEYREWRDKNPKAYKAQNLINWQIKCGNIKRCKCQLKDKFCSKGTIQAHHPNYDEPYNVVWLCASHHKKVDLGLLKLKINNNEHGNKETSI